MARYSQNDSNPYDIASTVPGTETGYRPNIRIGITPASGVAYNKPANLTVSDLTSTGATISWTAPEGTPTGYTYQYKKVSDADWSAETSVTATSVALSGLEPGEAYIFRVKAVYGTDGASGFTSINFTTDCDVITTFPWSEDFEGYATGNFNNLCWVNEHIDGTGTKIFAISTDQKDENSTKKLQLPDMKAGTTTKLVLPAMNLDGNYQFALDVYRSNSTYNNTYANEGIRVFVSVDGEIEGATEIGFIPREYNVGNSIIPAETAVGWYTYELPIPMTGTCHLILRGESQYCTATYMDNFVVELAKPLNLTVSDVTINTATISWIGNATSFNVQYKAASAKEWLTTNATASPLTITGLNDDTEYQVRVQACYGEQDVLSGWTDVINFTTDAIFCTPKDVVVNNILQTTADIAWTGNDEAKSYNLRYTTDIADDFFEDFENGLGYWTVIRNGEGIEETDWRILDPYDFSSSLPSAHSGNSAVLSRSYNSGKEYNVDNWLISPKVNIGSFMTYWLLGDSRFPEHYEIYVSTTTTDFDAFTKVYESDEGPDDWTEVTVDLSAYDGQKGYVAFRNIGSDADFLFIDDVAIAATSAQGNDWTTINNVTSSYTIEGLAANTKYVVEVQAVYADGESKWYARSFNTDSKDLELANDATDNSTLIGTYYGEEANVTLTGRTLYKDGYWNTICLPFDVKIEGSVLEGAVARRLTAATVTDNETIGQTLHLTFGDEVTDSLKAGVPYIIKWTDGDNITDPVFPGVTISNTYEGFDNGEAGDYRVRFLGSYNSVSLAAYDKSHLYFGANNKLLWPDQNVTLGACRAYFKIGENNAVNAKGITGFVIDFGDNEEATGIHNAEFIMQNDDADAWYTVDGIRLNCKPSKRGMYIHNGKKVVVE